jgi:phosphoribosylanthranilate isomerase
MGSMDSGAIGSRVDKLPHFPRVKICGVMSEADVEVLVDAGIDTVGFNLVPSSKRCLELSRATELAARARSLGISVVAVLMNPSPDQLTEVVETMRWDFVQLHGQEDPSELLVRCHGVPILKAISWSGRAQEDSLVKRWTDFARPGQAATKPGTQTGGASSPLAGFLVDAYDPVLGGGTGRSAEWGRLWPRPELLRDWPLMLAGGLNPQNAQRAILETHCDGVDVASGVEQQPGVKSHSAIRAFAEQARLGFSQLLD